MDENMRAILILSVCAISACHTATYRDDGTVQPFGGNNTYAINLSYVNGFTGARGTVDDYLNYANAKCSNMGMYMQPVHKDGSMFVFRCASQPRDPNWRKDGGVVTVETR
jgi:hypothetical protein